MLVRVRARAFGSTAATAAGRAAALVPNYVDGRFVPSGCRETSALEDPATGEELGRVPLNSTPQEIDDAVRAARTAWESWRSTPVTQRVRVLFKLRELIVSNLDSLAGIVTRELGKVPSDARGDVLRGLEVLEYSCGIAAQTMGHSMNNIARGLDCVQIREPLGVCLGICPFNFPAMIPLWMMPPALATGNAFILKPSELVPGAVTRIAELSVEAGVPPGILSVVQGGKDTANRLIDHPDIKAVSFVGSTSVGEHVHARATSRGKRAQCNLGAKNHAVVMPDCSPEQAVNAIIGAAFGASGQRCMALSVVVFVGEARNVLPNLVERARSLNLGTDDSADMGPVVTPQAKQRILALIQSGESDGAVVALDGRVGDVPSTSGNWLRPTILGDVEQDMRVYREEIFGPVLSCVHVETLDDAISLINANPYANGTAIFTQSGAYARKFQTEIDVGQVGVNVPIPLGTAAFGFTGSRGSIRGDLHFYGQGGVEFFTKPKNILTRWPEPTESSRLTTAIPT